MSKCQYCKTEFSNSVLHLHEDRCPKNPNNKPADPKKAATKGSGSNEAGASK